MTIKSKLKKVRRQPASFLVESRRLRIHLSLLWSVVIENRWPARFGLGRNEVQTIVRHSQRVVLLCCSVSASKHNQYSMFLVGSSDGFWSNTQPICTLHASVSSAICPPELWSASTELIYECSECIHSFMIFAVKRGESVWLQSFFRQRGDLRIVGYKFSKDVL